jgi:hypothetical protein
MSAPLTDVWGGCQTPTTDRPYPNTLLEHLEAEGLLAYGQLKGDDYLTDRDNERLRVLRFIADHPEGTNCAHVTSHVCKGVRPTKCQTSFDDDSDYRFVNRYVHDLANHDPPLVQITDPSGDFRITPTLDLLGLISYGISETAEDNDLIYDKEFCEQLLRSSRGDNWRLTDAQKDILADSFRRYLDRINDYRLAFDVTLDGTTGRSETRRMTKPYATRFNDEGRKKKSFARLHQSLDAMAEHGDTAVFTTFTCWPELQTSLYDAVQEINPAYHNLNQYLKTDPSTKLDTRAEGVPNWRPDLDDAVTGRPRERLEYLKVLEWTDAGYPHLHVLYADPPRRESDGMPWLIDNDELEQKWEDYGMARIVDTYPLVHRDDLKPEGTDDDDLDDAVSDLLPDLDAQANEVSRAARRCIETTVESWYRREHLDGARFNAPSGYVCWFQFGNHDRDDEWVEEQKRYDPNDRDDLIDFEGDPDDPMQKTAGSYIGKYISKTYGALMDSESYEDGEWTHEGEAAPWKIAMYWATGRQFWSISKGLRESIRRDDELDAEVRSAVNSFTRETIVRLSQSYHDDPLGDGFSVPRLKRAAHQIVRETVASVDFLGAFPIWSLPAETATAQPLTDLEHADRDPDSEVLLASTGDRPPPVTEAW